MRGLTQEYECRSVVLLDALAVTFALTFAHALPLASQFFATLRIELLVTLFRGSQALLFLTAE